ncbi:MULTISPECIES: RiPP maturation radical SAM C-methyltransferase [Streptomyces]|uniref:B12-binding domain-containing protein n=3 Tax=Streptomyces scabiei TaxID=1930 RepID=C9Z185_STRSW|nr:MULTISPECIES: RiPP maturation radical SAM C-methyltransferase [Streptomyces]MDW8473321.1 RiPP maturation radical SAM C-methyltransferase [Streptomyces scabiei]MDX2571125.1 RiPP maturation radical SAM C-methyltransferase [Streptomyces scabiei]MDX2577765.1 RiPP maturation radical SAM C-methyltransferase [Streptomyces scabiei]MDX2626421.1 RiPP maturation radical SAM C-methyltransferase [Streptomyces scabiei]MDX2656074.1 RiPP maturation radical SAM C-methyltransferase [Streptomyces scabiei]
MPTATPIAKNVSLVSMPWNSVVRPSIQVGILRSLAENEGWQVDARYSYLDFYGLAQRMLGFSDEKWAEAYELVSEKLYHLSVGDWIFSCRRGDAGRRDAYFAQLRARRVDDTSIELVDALRAVADRHVEDTAAALLESAPDVVGFTSMFSQNGPSLAVAERLRELGYGGVIVLGGSNCEGSMGRALLANFPAVDAIVDGPGEDAFVTLLHQVAAGEPPRSHGRLLTRVPAAPGSSPAAPLTTGVALDVPTPDYDGFFEQLHAAGLHTLEPEITLPVEFSRGCWWGAKTHCTFCGLNGATMAYRSKNPDGVADELRHLMDRYGVLDFFAVDNILDLKYLDTALPLVEKLNTDHSLFFEVKANMEWADIRAVRRAGVRSVQPGIESLSTEGLRHLRKGATAYQNIRFLLGCAEYGVRADWNILTGYPHETPDSLTAQLDVVSSLTHLTPPHITLIRFDRFSPYVEAPENYGLTLTSPLPGYRYAYPGLSQEDLWNIAYHFEGDFTDDPANGPVRRRLAARVRLWRAHHESARFGYRLGFDSLTLTDERPGLPPHTTTLRGEEARLFRAVVGGTRFRDLQGQEWQGERWDQALDTLHAWHRKRWVYIEGTKVIALAVREQPSAYRTPPPKGTPRRARPPVPLTLTARP